MRTVFLIVGASQEARVYEGERLKVPALGDHFSVAPLGKREAPVMLETLIRELEHSESEVQRFIVDPGFEFLPVQVQHWCDRIQQASCAKPTRIHVVLVDPKDPFEALLLVKALQSRGVQASVSPLPDTRKGRDRASFLEEGTLSSDQLQRLKDDLCVWLIRWLVHEQVRVPSLAKMDVDELVWALSTEIRETLYAGGASQYDSPRG